MATLRDDGAGLQRRDRPGGRAVGNMTRRAAAVGGSPTLVPSGPGAGTTLTWRAPAADC